MNESTKKRCNCKDHLVLNKKQVSTIISGLLLLSFLIFWVGYFFGKHKALSDFYSLSRNNSFNHQMHYALSRLQKSHPQVSNNMPENIPENPFAASLITTNSMDNEKAPLFQAELISFGSQNVAQQFVNRLQRNGINTTIIKHTGLVPGSKDASKTIDWYQVVTNVAPEQEIKEIVEAIKHIVKLNDVRMVKVNNGSIS